MDDFKPYYYRTAEAMAAGPPASAPPAPREAEPEVYRFRDDGVIPNNPNCPLLIYRKAVRLPIGMDPAGIFEQLFQKNGWGKAWRNGIYDFAHYHSRTHEVLGIARGRALVRIGGDVGLDIDIKAGDALIIPAGVGHQRLKASKNLLVVGAYPAEGEYDEFRAEPSNREKAMAAIAQVPAPKTDPLFGAEGPLVKLWNIS
ncbi:MAG TPA: cupin [Alphaproteobacteria bacterium]|nr:cupin [Alphaproteobacteria bacterium]